MTGHDRVEEKRISPLLPGFLVVGFPSKYIFRDLDISSEMPIFVSLIRQKIFPCIT